MIASKLIRSDELDQSDIQFLCAQRTVDLPRVEEAARSLPAPFNHDALAIENLASFRRDVALWRGEP